MRVRVLEAGIGRRRHLVLEPLSRRALRFRKLLLRLFLLAGAAGGMGLVGAFRSAARDPALSQLCRRQVRPAPRHPVPQPRDARRTTSEERGSWDVTVEDGSRLPGALPDHRDRPAVGADHAAHRGRRDVRGPVLPHRALAARAGELRRQAGGGDRHRRHRRADDPGGRQDRRAPDRVPAHAELVRAAAQQPDRRGDAGRDQGGLPRDVRALPRNLRLLPAHARSARHLRGDARGARGVLRETLRRARLRHLAGQFPRHPHRPRGQRGGQRLRGAQDPPAGEGPRRWPRS